MRKSQYVVLLLVAVLATSPVLATPLPAGSRSGGSLTRAELDRSLADIARSDVERWLAGIASNHREARIFEYRPRTPLDDLDEERRKTGLIKIIGGAAAAGLGVLLAATSSKTATASVGGFTAKATETSTGKLIGGIVLAAGGVWLIISGSKDRRETP